MGYVDNAQPIKEFKMKKKLLIAALITMLSASQLFSSQKVHTHGNGVLNISSTENKMVFELIIPAISLVGFEHEAATEAEKKAIKDGIEKLQKTSLFSLYETKGIFKKKSRIQLSSSKKSIRLTENRPTPSDDHHKHENHDHGDHHHQSKHMHDDHDSQQDKAESHSEFHILIEYEPQTKVAEIRTTVFETIDDIHKIDVSIVTDQQQSSAVITKTNTIIHL